MGGYAEQIRDTIQQIPYNQIFQASHFRQEVLTSVPEKTYYKSLERLTKQGELVHLAKGLYYRPKKENGNIIAITEEDIIGYYTKDFRGVVIGNRLYEKSGIAMQNDAKTEVLSNRLVDKQKHIGNVAVQKVDFILNDDTISVIETMEILQNYQKIENPNKGRFLAYMRNFAENYSEESTQYVLEKRKYKKSTVAFLQQILNWYGVENALDKHLSSLSEYKVPKLEDLKQEIPLSVQKCLKLYVAELERIYGNHLLNVLLYGSYARGDFNEESDIDIMILLDLTDMELKEYRNALSELTYDFNMENNLEIMPIAKDKAHFMKWVENYPFYANVKKEGVELFGVD